MASKNPVTRLTQPLKHGYTPHDPELGVRGVPAGDSMTQQHWAEATDINNILIRYQETGIIEHVKEYGEHYGDVDGTTFKEAMDIVANANSMFEELPSSARNAFDNDPAKFLDYVNEITEDDAPDLVQMGLMTEETAQAKGWLKQAVDEPGGPVGKDEPDAADAPSEGQE